MKNNAHDGLFGIEAASLQSGLSQHLIRIWERRYNAVRPIRTDTNRRLYTLDDINRLKLLQRALTHGHRIGDIAALQTSQLEEFASTQFGDAKKSAQTDTRSSARFTADALQAIYALDDIRLNEVISQASVRIGQMPMLELFLVPLLEEMGRLWRSNELRIVQEHLASTVIRNYLGTLLSRASAPPNAPILVTATFTGQHHELGAMIAAAIATQEGWRSIHLGANLSSEEIAQAVHLLKARAVALSFVFPPIDAHFETEIEGLRSAIPSDVVIFLGGRAAAEYFASVESTEIEGIFNFHNFRSKLSMMHNKITHVPNHGPETETT